jgi:hypothetical protein
MYEQVHTYKKGIYLRCRSKFKEKLIEVCLLVFPLRTSGVGDGFLFQYTPSKTQIHRGFVIWINWSTMALDNFCCKCRNKRLYSCIPTSLGVAYNVRLSLFSDSHTAVTSYSISLSDVRKSCLIMLMYEHVAILRK